MIIQILFIILFITFIIVIIYFFTKKQPKGGVVWNFNKPKSQCNTNTLKKNNSLLQQNYIEKSPPISKTILNMSIKPNSNYFNKLRNLNIFKDFTIPDNFSWRYKGGDMIETPRNQGQCGGCWAFAISSCIGDRFAIKNKIQAPKPSAVYLLSECSIPSNNGCATNQGCDGANVYDILKWLENNSLNGLESCWPSNNIIGNNSYGSPDENLAPSSLNIENLKNCCYDCCYSDNNKSNISTPSFSIKNNSIEYFGEPINGNKQYTPEIIDQIIYQIQKEIYNNGPVVTSFVVLDDFITFYNTNPSSAIYSNKNVIMDIDGCEFNDCSKLGYTNDGHAMCITGWGKDPITNQKYWEIRNSWGTQWADNGYGRIAFTTYDTLKYYIGIDIPIISNTTSEYFGGVTSFIPNDIQNFNELLNNGIFKRSTNKNI